jgi:hypothetical protein
MGEYQEQRISNDEFFPRLDEDIYIKFLELGEKYFDDAMMRHAYLQIQNVREAKARAEIARKINEEIQTNRPGHN